MTVFFVFAGILSLVTLISIAVKQRRERVTSMRRMKSYDVPQDFDPSLDEVPVPEKVA